MYRRVRFKQRYDMTDWQIIDGHDFPELPPESIPRPSSPWRWVILVGGILVFLFVVGFMTLGREKAESRPVKSENQISTELETEQQTTEISNSLPFPSRQTLTGLLWDVESAPSGSSRFYLSLLDPPGGIVEIEIPANMEFKFGKGVSLPSSCAASRAKLQIEAEFLDRERDLKAINVRVQNVSPIAKESFPEHTYAYMLVDGIDDIKFLVAIRGTESFSLPTTIRASGPSSFQEIVPLPTSGEEQPHFLLRLNLPDCEHTMYVHHKPGQDSSDYWIAPSETAQWIWRPDQEELLFFYQDTRDRSFLGWNIKTKRLVPAAMWVDGRYIGLLDLTERGILPNARYYDRPLRSHKLSPDGEWLAYLAETQNPSGPLEKLGVIYTSEQTDQTLIQVEPGEGLETPVWSLNLDQPQLAVLAGPVIDGEKIDPVRLLVASPNQPDNFTVIAEARAGERFASPVFCSDGALLYRVERDGQFQLQHQVPDSPAQTLLTQDHPFQPLACP